MVRNKIVPVSTPRRPRKRLGPKIFDRLLKANPEVADAATLHKLEKMAEKLQNTIRKLTPGPSRHTLLEEIGRFRARIVAMRSVGLRPESKGLKGESGKA